MKPNAYHIKNVRVFDPTLGLDKKADVLLSDGKIEAIGPGLKATGDYQSVEAEGKCLLPGLVDLHTHLREPGFEHKETVETGTRSAAAGGADRPVRCRCSALG